MWAETQRDGRPTEYRWRRLRDICQDVEMWCNFIMQVRGSPICIPYISRGENLQILPHSWGWCDFELV